MRLSVLCTATLTTMLGLSSCACQRAGSPRIQPVAIPTTWDCRPVARGGTLCVLTDTDVHAAIFGIQVSGGSMSDAPGQPGISHLAEHILMRGIRDEGDKSPNPNLALAISSISGRTRDDFSLYGGSIPRAALSDVFALFAHEFDRRARGAIEANEVRDEAQIVMREASDSSSVPAAMERARLGSMAASCPLRSYPGLDESYDAQASPTDIARALTKRLASSRFHVFVIGNVSWQVAHRETMPLWTLLDAWPVRAPLMVDFKAVRDVCATEAATPIELPATTNFISWTWALTPGPAGDDAEVQLAATLLDDKRSVVWRELGERLHSLDTFTCSTSETSASAWIQCRLVPSPSTNLDDLQASAAALWPHAIDELATMAQAARQSKKELRRDVLESLSGLVSRVMIAAECTELGREPNCEQAYLSDLDKASPEGIARAGHRWLSLDKALIHFHRAGSKAQ